MSLILYSEIPNWAGVETGDSIHVLYSPTANAVNPYRMPILTFTLDTTWIAAEPDHTPYIPPVQPPTTPVIVIPALPPATPIPEPSGIHLVGIALLLMIVILVSRSRR